MYNVQNTIMILALKMRMFQSQAIIRIVTDLNILFSYQINVARINKYREVDMQDNCNMET